MIFFRKSQKLSELTQAFVIPTGAKTLQFTIKDNHEAEREAFQYGSVRPK